MFQKVAVPVLGIVENMSTHVCSKCGHEEPIFGAGRRARMAEQYGVRLLGQLPLDIRIREETDGGAPDRRRRARRVPSAARIANGAPHGGRLVTRGGGRRPCFPRSPSRTADREHQVRPLDPPHGDGATA